MKQTKTVMNRKKYETPDVTVMNIDATCHLLEGSTGKTGPSGPGTSVGSGSSAAPSISGFWEIDEVDEQ